MAKKTGKLAAAVDKVQSEVQKGTTATWAASQAEDLHDFVAFVVDDGGLVSFSRTRDGSAVVLTILHDSLPNGQFKDYFGTSESIEQIIRHFADIYREG